MNDLCGGFRLLKSHVDNCSSDIERIDEVLKKMEIKAKEFVPQQEFSCLLKKFEDLLNSHEHLLTSHRSSKIDIAELQGDLDKVKHKLAEVQKELHSGSFYEQSMSIEEEDNSKQHVNNPGQSKRWAWRREFIGLKEITEHLSKKLKQIEGVVARITQSETPKRSKMDPFLTSLKELVEKQIEKNKLMEQQQAERRRSTSKRDSGYQDSVFHSTPQHPTQLQYQMSTASSAPDSPTTSVTSPVAINTNFKCPNTISEGDQTNQVMSPSSESPIRTSQSSSIPRTPSSFGDSAFTSLSQDIIAGEPQFNDFLHSLLELISGFESTSS